MNFRSILFTAAVCIIAILQTQAKPANPKDASSKITIYSVSGERFILYVNGTKQNTVPLSTVDVNDLKGAIIKVNVIFEDRTLAPLDKSIMRMAKDCSYEISKNKKGEYVINMKTAGALGNSSAQISQEIIMNDSGLIKTSTIEDKNKTPESDIKTSTKEEKSKIAATDVKTNKKEDESKIAATDIKTNKQEDKSKIAAIDIKTSAIEDIALDKSPPEIQILTPKVTSSQTFEADNTAQNQLFVSGIVKDLSGVSWININGTNITEIKTGGYFSMNIPGPVTKLVFQSSDTKGNIGMQTYTIEAPKPSDADIKAKAKKEEKMKTALKVLNKVDDASKSVSVSVTTVNSDGTVKHAGYNEQNTVQTAPAANTPATNNAANHGPIVPGTFTFFSEDGEKFTVFMENVKQNEVPQSSVVVSNVLSSSLRSEIVFENTAIPSIEKKGMRMWRNYIFTIKKNKKGKYELDTNGKGDLYGR